jgi:hypothetical protein
MLHLLRGTWEFIVAVFGHWQIWLSGGGIGGFMVIASSLFEKLTGKSFSKRFHLSVFVVAFFLCSCLLAWIDERDSGERLATQVKEGIQRLNSQRMGYETRFHEQDVNFRGQISDLSQGIAVREAVSQTLQRQNRDQQSTINGCLSQAMKLLTPEAQKTTVIFFDRDDSNVAIRTTRWLLLTNKPITPVRMAVQCDAYIQSANIGPISSGSMSSGPSRLGPNTWQTDIQSPAWTPTAPLMAIVHYRGGQDVTCGFVLR